MNFSIDPHPLFWNPVSDFLFTRVGGPVLYENHFSSAFFVLFIIGLYMMKDKPNAAKWFLVIITSVPIHELVLTTITFPTWINTPISPFVLNLRWFFWLGIVLAVGTYLAWKDETTRHKLLKFTQIVVVYDFFWLGLVLLFNINTLSIIEYQPGPAFYSIPENLLEVGGWFIPMFYWLDSKDFLIDEMHPHNYLRYLLFYKSRPFPIETTKSGKMLWFKESKDWEKEYLPARGVEGKVVLDVGAGCGETALFFFNHGARKVICVEPVHDRVEKLRRNAKRMNWDVEIWEQKFNRNMLMFPFDYAKLDCEGGEEELLSLNILPPLSVEIHTRELMEKFKKKYPAMRIEKKYLLFCTWMGKIG